MVEEAVSNKRRDVPTYLQTLIKQAELRKVHLISLPLGMSRQKENQTRYIFSKGLIMWFAKWILSSSSPSLTFTTKSSELSTIGDTFFTKLTNLSVCFVSLPHPQSHLYPLIAKYKAAGTAGLVILLEKYVPYSDSARSSGSKEYFVVPSEKSFRDVLAGVYVLE